MSSARKKIRIRKPVKIIIIVIGVLIILRLLLPYIVLHYANKTLADLDGYYGHINDIDISLYRGAYQINDMYLNNVDRRTGKQNTGNPLAKIHSALRFPDPNRCSPGRTYRCDRKQDLRLIKAARRTAPWTALNPLSL